MGGSKLQRSAPIGTLGEFDLIERVERIVERAPAPAADLVVGMGDDAAVLRLGAREELVVSSDASVEGVHFDFALSPARIIGRRALVANLSDLAAMGARPLGFTVAFAASPELSVARFDDLFRGLAEEARRWACPLAGGNMTRASETSLAITVLGAVPRGRALLRRGMHGGLRSGDRLFVTGALGASALSLVRARREGRPHRHVAAPRLHAGVALARLSGVRACIDISDGLVSELGHLLAGSGLGADVDAGALPMPRGFARACRRLEVDPIRLASGFGEDYELLFALSGRARLARDAAALGERIGAAVTEVARVSGRVGIRGLPESPGYRHFGAT